MAQTCSEPEVPIFIVGVPRSGTTLLRALLSAHPALTISPESHFFRFWIRQYRHLDLSDRHQFQVFWEAFIQSRSFESFGLESADLCDRLLAQDSLNFKTIFTELMQSYARNQGKKRWGEKTPDHYLHLSTLFEWYPQAQVLWLLRDPRAVTASLMQCSWASSQADVHGRTWMESLRLYETSWAKDPRVLLVQYEKLVQEPEAELLRLVQFLGEDWTPSLLNGPSRSPSVLGMASSQLTPHYQSALAPIHLAALDAWRSQLSPYQIAIIEYFAREGMSRYHYLPLTDRPSFAQLSQLFILTQLRAFKHRFRAPSRRPQSLLL